MSLFNFEYYIETETKRDEHALNMTVKVLALKQEAMNKKLCKTTYTLVVLMRDAMNAIPTTEIEFNEQILATQVCSELSLAALDGNTMVTTIDTPHYGRVYITCKLKSWPSNWTPPWQ